MALSKGSTFPTQVPNLSSNRKAKGDFGKVGGQGQGHDVWIPFRSGQQKSNSITPWVFEILNRIWVDVVTYSLFLLTPMATEVRNFNHSDDRVKDFKSLSRIWNRLKS